jgi:quercetin dioxygenase-like cupin family protein
MTNRQSIPVLDKPTLVRAGDTSLLLWGDEKTGFVNDQFHAQSKQLILVTISMPPGRRFHHSETNKPVYTGHTGLYVLEGQYTVQYPDTGEVRVAEQGELLVLRGPQWHFGYNFSDRELRVLETICLVTPPGAVADLPCPAPEAGFDREAIRDFPATRPTPRLERVSRHSALHVIVGERRQTLLRVLASTDKMTVAVFDLIGGQRTEAFNFFRDATLYVEKGRLNVRIEADSVWEELCPGDTFFFPAGATWEIFNHGANTASAHLSVAGNFAAASQRV